jgi:hypothetical protein
MTGEHVLDVTAMVAGSVTEDLVTDLLGDVIDPELGSTSSSSGWSMASRSAPTGWSCGWR